MDHISLDAQARAILEANDRGGYTVPTAGLYPYQWNWDSMFAAWGFSTFDVERAWAEIETLFSGQWDSGMVPHILFHRPDPGYFPGPDVWGCDGPVPSSGISQPPVAATFIRAVWEANRSAGDEHVRNLFDKMKAWHRWFMDWRSEDGAIFIAHPWEAGRDNAPDWDGAMASIDPAGVGEYTRRDTQHVNADMRPTKFDYDRYIWLVQLGRWLGWDDERLNSQNPFRVGDPGMTFILMRANRDLAWIGREIGRDVSDIESWTRELESGASNLWNPELESFDSFDFKARQFAGCLSNASFLCWYGGLASPEMERQLERLRSVCRYPVPSHDPTSDRFDAKRYWRGPTWGIMNALIGIGLADQGRTAEADALRRDTAGLISENGFAEYFDPMTGEAAGGGTFTWTAAIWLAWASPSAGREES